MTDSFRTCQACGVALTTSKQIVACSHRCASRLRWVRRPSIDERFFANVHMTDRCWTWTGTRHPDGYGTLGGALAHRVMYERCVGPIPKGFHIDHLCRNRSCVRLDHLEVVTPRTNALRGVGFAARNAAKSRCPHGHVLDARIRTGPRAGARKCRTCAREQARRRRAS
jgi:hypothetical protein